MTKVLIALLLQLTFVAGAAAMPDEGDVPPDQVGLNKDGSPIRLSEYKGKAVVLSFWATWCGYCRKELPVLHNIQRKAGKDRIQVIAINTEDRKIYRTTTRELEKNIDIALLHDPDGAVRQAYGVQGIPHMVIIGRDGRIVSVHRGYNESMLGAIASNINLAMTQDD